jgi:hypothetical protein
MIISSSFLLYRIKCAWKEDNMKRLIEFPLTDGGSIRVEVDELDKGATVRAARGDIPEKARQTFEEAVSNILPVTSSVVEKLRSLGSTPDELEVVFGFNLSAEAGVIIASASTSANFGVAMRWAKENRERIS